MRKICTHSAKNLSLLSVHPKNTHSDNSIHTYERKYPFYSFHFLSAAFYVHYRIASSHILSSHHVIIIITKKPLLSLDFYFFAIYFPRRSSNIAFVVYGRGKHTHIQIVSLLHTDLLSHPHTTYHAYGLPYLFSFLFSHKLPHFLHSSSLHLPPPRKAAAASFNVVLTW